MDELNIKKLSKGKSKNIKIGELNQKVIDMLHLDLKPQKWEYSIYQTIR